MGMFSSWVGQLFDAGCRKDSAGRLVFLPYGRRGAGYYLDSSSNYQNVKALASMYAAASMLFQVLGSTGSLIIVMAATVDRRDPLAFKLELALIVYTFSSFTFCWLPMLVIWRLYKSLLPGLCSSLEQVGPEAMGNLQTIPNSLRRHGMIVAFAGVLVMLAVIFMVSRAR